MTIAGPTGGYGRSEADLGALTGVRSGKRSFYPEYLRSAERLENAVRALDSISRALVRTTEGPRALIEAILIAASEHLQADWVVVVLADGALKAARPRQLLLSGGEIKEESGGPVTVEHAEVLRARPWEAEDYTGADGVVRVGMTLDGEYVGGIAGLPARHVLVSDTDLAILRVLANHAAVAMHNSYLLHSTTKLRGRTEQLSEAAAQKDRDLAAREAELAETHRRLIEAMQAQALDYERHRIARELHDSVAQDVLSAGMTIELCRAQLLDDETDTSGLLERLTAAKGLTRKAVERLRAAIYALHHGPDECLGSLPDMLERLSTVHLPSDVKVRVVVRGAPIPLPGEAEHAILRITGEALFNTVAHTNATQAVVRLNYRENKIALSVSDDGNGDPVNLRRMLRLAETTDLAGAHRGLANMLARAQDLGGTLMIRRSPLGGITVLLDVPLPLSGLSPDERA
ncbi:MadS family sensor histidine kinase [Hoyosella altamirensis]|uniref:Signal transduction histidine kinase n=1 Tax=Hoyosella altamirensis TaxID=616997 RepID=A0A839RQZ9_9ACTN|nr:histidine kinase [Hoyosella altamirensis]MBB3038383.1 signal transduction histidine kinase [Hoyosella altamirensis]